MNTVADKVLICDVVEVEGIKVLPAPVGSGKSYFAIRELSKYGKVLFLAALKNLVDEVKVKYSDVDFDAYTFSGFSKAFVQEDVVDGLPKKSYDDRITTYSFIVIDEAHDIIDFNGFMSHTIDISNLMHTYPSKTILMTATPLSIKIAYGLQDNSIIPSDTELVTKAKPRKVVLLNKRDELIDLIINQTDSSKGIYFAKTIKRAKEIEEKLNQHDIQAVAVVSKSSSKGKELMSSTKRSGALKSIIDTGRFPDEVDIIISTTVLREGINIVDTRVNYVYTEWMNAVNLIQISGRVRHGVKCLYGHLEVSQPKFELNGYNISNFLKSIDCYRKFVDDANEDFKIASVTGKNLMILGLNSKEHSAHSKYLRYNPYSQSIEFDEEKRASEILDFFNRHNLSNDPKSYISKYLNIDVLNIEIKEENDNDYKRTIVDSLIISYEGKSNEKAHGKRIINREVVNDILFQLFGVKQYRSVVTKLNEIGYNAKLVKDSYLYGKRVSRYIEIE